MSETELVERLERLEATIYGAQPVPQKITAHEFEVVDSMGNRRVSMGVGSGVAFIHVYDAEGHLRAMMGVSPSDGPAIGVLDAQGRPRADMHFSTSGGPGIILSDAQGKLSIDMAVDPSGGPNIMLSDAQGKVSIGMGVDLSGAPNIMLHDPQGFEMDLGSPKTRTPRTGQTHQTSAASIVMLGNDRPGHVIWKAP
jgi:hypothetical protein